MFNQSYLAILMSFQDPRAGQLLQRVCSQVICSPSTRNQRAPALGMAKILYSTCGEGRGHATRVRAVVEALRSDHQFVILAPGDAYHLLAPHYHQSEIKVHRMAGLRFQYRPDGSLDH